MNMQERADRLVRNEVNVCLSALVSTLAEGYGTVQHAMPRWNHRGSCDLADLAAQAFELCTPIDDWEEAAIQAGWVEQQNGDWTKGSTEGLHDWIVVAGSSEACEYDDIDPYQCEIFEHWSISQSLADDLATLGERVDNDFAGMCVWGRTTTGQGIAQDGVIRRVLELHDARLAKLEATELAA